jgi:hypothetical protein
MSKLNYLPAHQLAAIKGSKMETCRHCSEQRNQTVAYISFFVSKNDTSRGAFCV